MNFALKLIGLLFELRVRIILGNSIWTSQIGARHAGADDNKHPPSVLHTQFGNVSTYRILWLIRTGPYVCWGGGSTPKGGQKVYCLYGSYGSYVIVFLTKRYVLSTR